MPVNDCILRSMCYREQWAAQAHSGSEILIEQKLKVIKRALKKMLKMSKRQGLNGSWNATSEDVKASADVRARMVASTNLFLPTITSKLSMEPSPQNVPNECPQQ